jgi:hypothetical protein
MATVTKNRKMSSNFNCSYMTMSRLTNILGLLIIFLNRKNLTEKPIIYAKLLIAM